MAGSPRGSPWKALGIYYLLGCYFHNAEPHLAAALVSRDVLIRAVNNTGTLGSQGSGRQGQWGQPAPGQGSGDLTALPAGEH